MIRERGKAGTGTDFAKTAKFEPVPALRPVPIHDGICAALHQEWGAARTSRLQSFATKALVEDADIAGLSAVNRELTA
jgi:hypothetical protein